MATSDLSESWMHAPRPDLAALASALNDFVDAPTWDDSLRILDARRDVLFTVDASLALVRRLGHATSSNRRGLLSTAARLLIIARDSGVDAARAWLDTRHRAEDAFTAILESVNDLPPSEAQAAVQRAVEALPIEQRRYIEEMLLEAAEAAADQESQDEDALGHEQDDSEQALRALISAEGDAATLSVVERYQAILTDGRAAATLRANAARLHQDPQPGASAFADHLDRLAELVERVARQGLAAARGAPMTDTLDRYSSVEISAEQAGTSTPDILGSYTTGDTRTTLTDPQRVRVPTDRDRAIVNILVQSGQLNEPIRRGLQAWIGTPGVVATREEIAAAYGLFRETTRPRDERGLPPSSSLYLGEQITKGIGLGVEGIEDTLAPIAARVGPDAEAGESVAPEASEDLGFVGSPGDDVQFTAFYPRIVAVDVHYTLAVYMHIAAAMAEVRQDVLRFSDEMRDEPHEVSAPALQPLSRGVTLTIVPACAGVTFNPEYVTFKWMKDRERTTFDFVADKQLAGSAVNAEITIYAGPLIIGILRLPIVCDPHETPSPHDDEQATATARMLRSVFASYSHDDEPIVIACRNAYTALGLKFWRDRDDLGSGQLWEPALEDMIRNADVFQLFWSPRSSQSPYVREEWKYALGLQRSGDFIRPVYWEQPLSPVPQELSTLNFRYMPLARMDETANTNPSAPATRSATTGESTGVMHPVEQPPEPAAIAPRSVASVEMPLEPAQKPRRKRFLGLFPRRS